MSRKKRVAKKKVEEKPIGGKHAPLPEVTWTPVIEAKAGAMLKDELKKIVADLEADPLLPLIPQYPREYGEKMYPRYQRLLAQLKKLAGDD